jgi:penicillin-binding protein 2
LALVSRPAYDPNQFVAGISHDQWNALVNDPSRPMLNRAIQAQLAPGSVFKIMMAAAALEAGTLHDHTTFYCPGRANFYGRTFRCWQARGHGRVDVHKAIVQSCDVFFYNVGRDLGIDLIAEYSARFGLGIKTGIDLPNEQAGTLPSQEWKEKTFREKWYPGETISVAIGQGALTMTPLQVAYSVGGIASGGKFVRPHLVLRERSGEPYEPVDASHVSLSDETIAIVTDALYGVVNEGGGTGARARVVGIDIGGKTGTAQVASLQLVNSSDETADLRDNAWFVGLAPRRNPEIVVAVLYQGGEHGSLAAPLARDVIKAYFDKKNGQPPQHRFSLRTGPEPRLATAPPPIPSEG